MITPEKAKEYEKIAERAKYSTKRKDLNKKQAKIWKEVKNDIQEEKPAKKYLLQDGTLLRFKKAPVMILKNKVGVLVIENKKETIQNRICTIYWNFESNRWVPNVEYLFYPKLIEYLDAGIFEIVTQPKK